MDEQPKTREECREKIDKLKLELDNLVEEQQRFFREINERDRQYCDQYWYLLGEITRLENIEETFN